MLPHTCHSTKMKRITEALDDRGRKKISKFHIEEYSLKFNKNCATNRGHIFFIRMKLSIDVVLLKISIVFVNGKSRSR